MRLEEVLFFNCVDKNEYLDVHDELEKKRMLRLRTIIKATNHWKNKSCLFDTVKHDSKISLCNMFN